MLELRMDQIQNIVGSPVNLYRRECKPICSAFHSERHAKSEKQVNNAAFEEQDGTQNYYRSSMTSLN